MAQVNCNQRGSALLPILIALSMVSILILAYTETSVHSFTVELSMKRQASLEFIKAALETRLQNNESWIETQKHEGSFACLATGTCTTLAATPFAFYSLDGIPLTGNNSYGYTRNGFPCSSLEQNCKLKYEFEWRPLCANLAACVNPVLEIVGKLKNDNTDEFMNLNLSKFKIVIYRRL